MNDTTSTPTATTPRRSRAQAWILITAFFAPLLLAFLLYYGGSWFGAGAWRPVGSTNHGDLIDPARPLPSFDLITTSGTPFNLETLHGKWNVLYVGDGGCDARCREALVLMRQTRLALNDDMSRIQRIFLATGSCCDQPYLDTDHSGLVVVPVDNSTGRELLSVFPEDSAGNRQDRIYIVDPLGNLMMSYGPQSPHKGLLEDLKKLLKLSHIG